jgi:hypothetical protein
MFKPGVSILHMDAQGVALLWDSMHEVLLRSRNFHSLVSASVIMFDIVVLLQK